MDREILFRGKRPEDGEWVESHGIMRFSDGIYKLDTIDKWMIVDPSTVGQYTGLTDKNGAKIFEGDICKDSMGFVFEVQWDNENARFLGRHEKQRGDVYICYVGRMPAVEVVGNIHDNPELMGGEDDG